MLLYDGFHKIEAVEHNGKVKEALLIKSAVSGIVKDVNNKICLVRQYRPAVGHETWEIPAGVLDKNLTIEEILIEEFVEECNMDPNHIVIEKQLTNYYMIAGSSNATNTIFLVSYHLEGKDMLIQDDDVLEAKWFTKEEFEQLIVNGQIKDAKTLLAFSVIKEDL